MNAAIVNGFEFNGSIIISFFFSLLFHGLTLFQLCFQQGLWRNCRRIVNGEKNKKVTSNEIDKFSRYCINVVMNYKMLLKLCGGRAEIARKMNVTNQMVSLWSVRGLPKTYRRRMDLLGLIAEAEIPRDLKCEVLNWASDPNN